MVVIYVFVVAVIGVVAAAVVETAARPAVAPSFLLPSRSVMALDWLIGIILNVIVLCVSIFHYKINIPIKFNAVIVCIAYNSSACHIFCRYMISS